MCRTCAVCSKNISHADICEECRTVWCTGLEPKNYPEWLKELVKIQSAFDRNYATIKEDCEVDLIPEKEYLTDLQDLQENY
jgi:hypothetical protein